MRADLASLMQMMQRYIDCNIWKEDHKVIESLGETGCIRVRSIKSVISVSAMDALSSRGSLLTKRCIYILLSKEPCEL